MAYAFDNDKSKRTLANVATSGSYNDLTNKPDLKAVATSGKYSDLTKTPYITRKQIDIPVSHTGTGNEVLITDYVYVNSQFSDSNTQSDLIDIIDIKLLHYSESSSSFFVIPTEKCWYNMNCASDGSPTNFNLYARPETMPGSIDNHYISATAILFTKYRN